jgi:signal transduction histidine kinase
MSSTSPQVPTPPAKVLIIDDNESNRILAQETLEDEGHTTILAASGREGIAAFEREAPDCVLLDVRMPDLDGFRVCEEIRKRPGGAEAPVIFFTALRDVDTFDRALSAGGDDFLTKPIRPTELVVRVHTALQLRQMRNTVRENYELFKQQRDALLRLQLEKERVMSFVVHDLKNPVNTVDLHAQTLLLDRSLPPVVHESAQHIRGSSRQLSRMIMNLLDVAKADEGQLAPKRLPLDLTRVVSGVLEELNMIAVGRKVQLARSLEAPILHAEEDLFHRVLANLVENALRYAPTGSTVRVSSRPVEGGVEVRVADAGRGIPEGEREKVFDAFNRVDEDVPPSRENRGLGLTFCKRAVEAHGGRIWVEDAKPGAIFCAFFPNDG